MVASNPLLHAKSLTKNYGRKAALDRVSLELSGGGVIALLGPNGAGKTTFVQTALGLARPSSGSLTLFGQAAGSKPNRQRIGVMMQDTDLPDALTGRELLSLFSSYYPDPAPADGLIDTCGLEAFVDQRYGRLSGGQKRRIQFALSLIGQPEILFLDEPTTGLDGEARRSVWAVIRDIAKEGALVILTTHYLEEADALADRVVVLENGHIVADDTAHGLRNQVGGALIQFETDLSDSDLTSLCGVRRLRRSGRRMDVLVENSVAFLKSLFESDPNPVDLTVRQPTLEEAFDSLTRQESV